MTVKYNTLSDYFFNSMDASAATVCSRILHGIRYSVSNKMILEKICICFHLPRFIPMRIRYLSPRHFGEVKCMRQYDKIAMHMELQLFSRQEGRKNLPRESGKCPLWCYSIYVYLWREQFGSRGATASWRISVTATFCGEWFIIARKERAGIIFALFTPARKRCYRRINSRAVLKCGSTSPDMRNIYTMLLRTVKYLYAMLLFSKDAPSM